MTSDNHYDKTCHVKRQNNDNRFSKNKWQRQDNDNNFLSEWSRVGGPISMYHCSAQTFCSRQKDKKDNTCHPRLTRRDNDNRKNRPFKKREWQLLSLSVTRQDKTKFYCHSEPWHRQTPRFMPEEYIDPETAKCVNYNECNVMGKSVCPHNSLCIDTEGSYRCGCDDGYVQVAIHSGFICADIDELGLTLYSKT